MKKMVDCDSLFYGFLNVCVFFYCVSVEYNIFVIIFIIVEYWIFFFFFFS